jgi:hypothetical protein
MLVKHTSHLPNTATRYLLVGMDGDKANTLEVKVWSLATVCPQTTSKAMRTTTLGQEVMVNHQLNSHHQDPMAHTVRVADMVRMTKAHHMVAKGRGALAETRHGKRWYRYLGVDGSRALSVLGTASWWVVLCNISVDL